MPATSETQIANAALIKCGAERIISLNDENERARMVKERYQSVRNRLLRAHPWNFAIKRVQLAALAEDPDWEFDFQFQLPADCLRVLSTDMVDGSEWRIENIDSARVLLCNSSEIRIKYIALVTDVGKYDDMFVEALACSLAADIAYKLTNSTTLSEAMKKDAEIQVGLARSFDAQEGYGDKIVADDWLVTRY